ncbi:MAG: arsenate reductase ArsC [Methanobrevibacter sp.]|nr:arsenate reductase ArsC [Methanobrevibacter sp.]
MNNGVYNKKKILFICKNNSIRSQIAEAIVNSLYDKTHMAFSGGTEVKSIHENTIRVLKEINIDISNKKSKNIEIFKKMKFNHVITVCEDDNCPFFPNANNHIHKKFKNPDNSLKPENLDSFREVRDEIKKWLAELVENEII